MHELRELRDQQAGVVSRRQLLALGWSDNDIRREVRNRRLAPVHRGVFVNHTGPLTWLSRAWAAVLLHDGSALCGWSAMNLRGDPIHVALPPGRHAAVTRGIVVHRLKDLEARVLWNRSPPRLRIEDATLDVAGSASSSSAAVAVISEVCSRRATTPERLLEALDRRRRTPRGVELRRVLADAADGTRSVLERDYLHRVERPHGLPRGRRQTVDRLDTGAVIHRDVTYDEWGVAVELDGWRWHGGATARTSDMSRDLASAAIGLVTLRVGWRHVWDEPCRTAARIAQVLQRRGWTAAPGPCSGSCSV